MKIYLLAVVFSLLFVCNAQALMINEIMPNPSDEKNEWLEIYNPENEEINLSLLQITDNKETDSITCYIIENCSLLTNDTYILIIGRNANITEITNETITYYYVDDTKIGNYLGNGGDNLSIVNSTDVIDNVSYPPFPDEMEGYSWCRVENGSWFFCDSPTPGGPNLFINTSTNQTNEDETNTTNTTCDFSLSITSDLIFISGEKHNYYLTVNAENCDQKEKEVSIDYWIEDLFGGIVSKRTTTKNITCYKNISRQWTPKAIEGTEAFRIMGRIINSTCNDSEDSNNFAERIVIVKGEKSKGEKPCPDKCPPCNTVESSCYCPPCPECKIEEKEFEVIQFPREVRKDEEIEILLMIRNPSEKQKNYSVYSYIYEDKRLLSEGYKGNYWLNTWNANEQNVSIPENSSVLVKLKNRIVVDTKPGKYKLRVRIRRGGERHDITKDIIIKEPFVPPANQTTKEENKTEKKEFKERRVTGRIVSRTEGDWFSSFIEGITNFFKNLLNIK